MLFSRHRKPAPPSEASINELKDRVDEIRRSRPEVNSIAEAFALMREEDRWPGSARPRPQAAPPKETPGAPSTPTAEKPDAEAEAAPPVEQTPAPAALSPDEDERQLRQALDLYLQRLQAQEAPEEPRP